MQPAQYYSAKVQYPDFFIDYYFMDTNVFDTWPPMADPGHNICSKLHTPSPTTCGVQGPTSPEECPHWFKKLWAAQVPWLEKGLQESTADWQIVVVHHPPEGLWGGDTWKRVSYQYGIDMIISGHRHRQEIHYMKESNDLRPTAYIVSGGGGGITSENEPKRDGTDDEYGFVDLTLSKREIMIEALSHGGQIRSTTCVKQVQPNGQSEIYTWQGPSLCDGKPAGPQPLPTTSTQPPPAGFLPPQPGQPSQPGQPNPAGPVWPPPPADPPLIAALKRLFGRFR